MNLPNPNPVIIANPTNQLVNPGATVTFSVTVGGPSRFRYQWRLGTSDILSATNATLILTNVQAANQGIYTVLISNGAGSVASTPATLTLRRPPFIASGLSNQIVNLGGNAIFIVSATGDAPFTYQWRFQGTNVIPGAAAPSLLRNAVKYTDGGTYSVTVSNAAGFANSRAFLYVRPKIANTIISNNALLVTAQGTPGIYYLQSAIDLTNWGDVDYFSVFTNLQGQIEAPITPTNRFYRLRVP